MIGRPFHETFIKRGTWPLMSELITYNLADDKISANVLKCLFLSFYQATNDLNISKAFFNINNYPQIILILL